MTDVRLSVQESRHLVNVTGSESATVRIVQPVTRVETGSVGIQGPPGPVGPAGAPAWAMLQPPADSLRTKIVVS